MYTINVYCIQVVYTAIMYTIDVLMSYCTVLDLVVYISYVSHVESGSDILKVNVGQVSSSHVSVVQLRSVQITSLKISSE